MVAATLAKKRREDGESRDKTTAEKQGLSKTSDRQPNKAASERRS